MPCRDYEETPREYQAQINELERRTDELTALLCVACSTILSDGDLPEALQPWYDRHRAADLNNMAELISFTSYITKDLSKSDFDALDRFLTELRNRY